ncbi:MAG: PAS domain-containing protein, partial [Oscillospiraceae bacterium]|nr:PAS domain-containing protein [Oscillospiraceae bacterium]
MDRAAYEFNLMKYKLANDALNIAMWDLNNVSSDPIANNDIINYSQELRHMLGFTDENDFPDILSSWAERIHPEDAERVNSAVAAFLGDRSGQTPFDVEHRLMHKNGKYRYFRTFGTTLRDSEGVPLRVAGALMDIDEQVNAQREIFESSRKLERREKMLAALNEMSMTFLSREKESLGDIMNKGLKPLTNAVGVNRVAIYRVVEGTSKLGQIYLWDGETIPLEKELLTLPESAFTVRWLKLLNENGYYNANVGEMEENAAAYLRQFGVKAMFSAPIYEHGNLWGVIVLEDYTNYRYFDEDCIDLLQSAAHLCANTVIRDEMERNAAADKVFIRDIIDAAPTGILIRNNDFDVIDCNDAFVKLLGSRPKEDYLINRIQFSPEYQPDGVLSTERIKQLYGRALIGEELTFEWMLLSDKGKLINCEITLKRVKYNNSYIVLAYVYDLRKIKKMERDVASTETTQIMLNSVPIGCTLIDRDCKLIDCNEEAVKLFGAASKQDVLNNFYGFSTEFQPSGRTSEEQARVFFKRAFSEKRLQFEWWHKNAEGESFPCEVTLVRVKYKDDYIIAGYTRDLRDIREAEAETREAEERTQIMLDATPLCSNFINRDLCVIDCNQAAANLFDLSCKDDYNKNFYSLSPEFQPNGRQSKEFAAEKIVTAFDEGYNRFEWMHMKLNGELIPCEITLVRVKHKDDYVVAGYTRDLRETKAAEAKTREAEERTQIMLDATPLGANLWNRDIQNIRTNDEAARLFGLSSKQEYLDNFFLLSPEFQPDGSPSSERAAELVREAFDVGYLQFEWMHQNFDKEQIPCEITLIRIKEKDD